MKKANGQIIAVNEVRGGGGLSPVCSRVPGVAWHVLVFLFAVFCLVCGGVDSCCAGGAGGDVVRADVPAAAAGASLGGGWVALDTWACG